jgi:hypothetical protein
MTTRPQKSIWSTLMKLFKAALMSAAMVATGAVAAYAADPTSPVPAKPPQVASSPARTLGPKAGPNIGIPAATPSVAPSAGVPSAAGSPWGTNGPSDSGGNNYAHPGFGPKAN